MAIINGTAANDTLVGTTGSDVVRMRGGNDLFIWNDGDGSDKVEGQAGFDTLRFVSTNASENITIDANGTRARLFRDVDLVTMDLNGIERVQVQALAGNDFIWVYDLAGTGVQQVAIDLAGTVGGAVGDGKADTVTRLGTGGNDTINVVQVGGKVSVTGLSSQMIVSHADASDTVMVWGLGGNDTINASALNAGVLQLIAYGGAGADKLIGSKGNDILYSHEGNDVVVGNHGDDFALLGTGNDLFVWNAGDGNDLVEGEAGFDTVRFTGSAANEIITISPSGGHALLSRNIGAVVLDTNDVERLEVRALGGKDSITVNDLAGTEVTQVAIDLAAKLGGALADTKIDTVTVNGSVNDDIIDVSWSGGKVVTTGLAASVSIAHAGATDILAIQGGAGDDILSAGSLPAGKISLRLLGGDGNDVLFGSAGADAVRGGTGNDIAFLGAGNDVFFRTPGDGDDLDTIEGQAGFDTLQFTFSADESISVSAADERAQVLRNIGGGLVIMDLDDVERVRVQAAGGEETIVVHNLAGTDVKQVAIDLAAAAGGAVGDGERDDVDALGTDGNDQITVAMSGGAASVTGLPAQVTIAHFDAIDYLFLYGGGGNDTINAATMPANVLGLVVEGDDGNDIVTGGAGNDVMYGENGKDTLRGGGGDDIMSGGDSNDRLVGGAGKDNLFGDSGDDVLLGGLGDDNLTGGKGNDTITAGAGNDTVFYTSKLDGHDVILDFDGNPAGGQDVLDLDALFDSLSVAAADRAGRVQLTDNGATVNVAVDADGSGINGFELVVATLHTTDVITKGGVGQDVFLGT